MTEVPETVHVGVHITDMVYPDVYPDFTHGICQKQTPIQQAFSPVSNYLVSNYLPVSKEWVEGPALACNRDKNSFREKDGVAGTRDYKCFVFRSTSGYISH